MQQQLTSIGNSGKFLILLGLSIWLGALPLYGQVDRTFDRNQWTRLVEDLNYTEELNENTQQQDEEDSGRANSNGTESPLEDPSGFGETMNLILKVVSVLVLLIALFFLIKAIVDANSGARNKKIKKQKTSPSGPEEIEEKLLETDLIVLIREAVDEGDFRWAIRLYYLQTLKSLSERRFIEWKREKTNRTYLRELGEGALSDDFQHLTLSFDRLWYGMAKLDRSTFEEIAPRFQQFLTKVESQKTRTPQLT